MSSEGTRRRLARGECGHSLSWYVDAASTSAVASFCLRCHDDTTEHYEAALRQAGHDFSDILAHNEDTEAAADCLDGIMEIAERALAAIDAVLGEAPEPRRGGK